MTEHDIDGSVADFFTAIKTGNEAAAIQAAANLVRIALTDLHRIASAAEVIAIAISEGKKR